MGCKPVTSVCRYVFLLQSETIITQGTSTRREDDQGQGQKYTLAIHIRQNDSG